MCAQRAIHSLMSDVFHCAHPLSNLIWRVWHVVWWPVWQMTTTNTHRPQCIAVTRWWCFDAVVCCLDWDCLAIAAIMLCKVSSMHCRDFDWFTAVSSSRGWRPGSCWTQNSISYFNTLWLCDVWIVHNQVVNSRGYDRVTFIRSLYSFTPSFLVGQQTIEIDMLSMIAIGILVCLMIIIQWFFDYAKKVDLLSFWNSRCSWALTNHT